MRVLLVATPVLDLVDGEWRTTEMDQHRVCPAYGIYLLAAVLREHGHDVDLVDLTALESRDLTPFASTVMGADLVGIGATSLCWATAIDVVRQVGELAPELPVVVGNIHATLFDRHALESSGARFAIRGEAEVALPALVDALAAGASDARLEVVPGLSWTDASGAFRRNPAAEKIAATALESAPLPAYDLMPAGVFKSLALESSRGCVLNCSFCSTLHRRSWRPLSADGFVDRLQATLRWRDKTTCGTVQIVDDEFGTNPKRGVEIARRMEARGVEAGLIFDARAVDFLKHGFAEAIAPHTDSLLVGAECGYDEGLARVGKGITTDILARTAAKLNQLGIADRADFSFILGLPWETIDEVRKTLAFAGRLQGEYGVRVRYNWYLHVPGSQLFAEARAAGRVSESMYDEHGSYRSLEAFRAGHRLAPDDYWTVHDIVAAQLALSRSRAAARSLVAFHWPPALEEAYPRRTYPPTCTKIGLV